MTNSMCLPTRQRKLKQKWYLQIYKYNFFFFETDLQIEYRVDRNGTSSPLLPSKLLLLLLYNAKRFVFVRRLHVTGTYYSIKL